MPSKVGILQRDSCFFRRKEVLTLISTNKGGETFHRVPKHPIRFRIINASLMGHFNNFSHVFLQ